MAAKTFDEWVHSTYSFVHPNMVTELKPCWDAATKAAEEKFTSTNSAIAPLQQISGNCGGCIYSDGNAYSACNTCVRNPMFEDFYEVATAQ